MSVSDLPRVSVLLADGEIATVRGFDREDGAHVRDLHSRASDDSIRRRFFALDRRSGDRYVEHLEAADPADTAALVAELGGQIVAVAGYELLDAATAEVAFFVDDRLQGKGVGTLLLEHLAAVGRRRGVRTFRAEVLVDNHGMIRVFRDAGFDLQQQVDQGVVLLTMSTTATERAVAAADARERAAEARSLRPLLTPTSVAVAGASRSGSGVGRAILDNIRTGGFTGRLYALHPHADRIGDVPAYRSFDQLPEPVDLLVIAVPAEQVLQVVTAAARSGTRSAVVITAGLAEQDPAGARTQREIVRVARRHGMRLVGPNCLGVLDTAVRLNATFATVTPPRGGLAVASQSGGVGIALLDAAARDGVGIANFVSLGNKADVSGNDLLAAWTDDPDVRAAALYLESFGNPRKFARLASRFAEHKPLFATVGGRSASGQRAGRSHTAAAAAPAVAVDALCAQAGVTAVRSTDELIEAAHLMLDQPLPAGRRLGIVGNAGGIGVLAADAAQAAGLVVPELSERVRAGLDGAAIANPLDLGAAATPELFGSTLQTLLDSGEVDGAVVMFAATRVGDTKAVLAAIEAATRDRDAMPVAVVLLGVDELPTDIGRSRIPVYGSAEAAIRAFGHAARYAAWRRARREAQPAIDGPRVVAARDVVDEVLTGAPDGRWLAPAETRRLLAPYGVVAPIGEVVESDSDAVSAADRVGYPVVVKSADSTVVHRSDRGLVLIGLNSPEEVREAYTRIGAMQGVDRPSVLVQPQITGGIEIAVGAVRDPAFGPLVMVAAGGVATDVWDDRVFLLTPVTAEEISRALRSLRIAPLLLGHRGSPPSDLADVERIVGSVARLSTDLPELAELDLNPVLATPSGARCIDAKLRLSAALPLDEGVPRRLSDPR